MNRLERILNGIKCCSEGVSCHRCEYKKYRAPKYTSMGDCQDMLMWDICEELNIDDDGRWTGLRYEENDG